MKQDLVVKNDSNRKSLFSVFEFSPNVHFFFLTFALALLGLIHDLDRWDPAL